MAVPHKSKEPLVRNVLAGVVAVVFGLAIAGIVILAWYNPLYSCLTGVALIGGTLMAVFAIRGQFRI
jgi:hypothetical protein